MAAGPASEEVTEVLKRRARRLAEPAADTPVEAVDLLVFSAADARLAAPARRVREVLAPGPTARLPTGAQAMVGLRAVRGAVVVVADPTILLGVGSGGPQAAGDRFAVVLDHPVAPVGVLTDRVDGVLTLFGGVRPTPDNALLEGITGGGVLVLDVDAVLAHPGLASEPLL